MAEGGGGSVDLAFGFCGGTVFLTTAGFFFIGSGRGSGCAAGGGATNGLWTSEARYWHTETAAAWGRGGRGGGEDEGVTVCESGSMVRL